DATVTGVQTCALPIYEGLLRRPAPGPRRQQQTRAARDGSRFRAQNIAARPSVTPSGGFFRRACFWLRLGPRLGEAGLAQLLAKRSEERRVGKGGRCRW